MSFWLGLLALSVCCFSAVVFATVCNGKPKNNSERRHKSLKRQESSSETDDTFRAVREKQQIRREMPPEVLEHMARVYDLPHGASPAYGMRNLHLHDIEVDMALCKTLSVEELMKRANEYSLSESVSSPGGPVELLDSLQKAAQAEKVQKDLTRRSRSSASSRPELK